MYNHVLSIDLETGLYISFKAWIFQLKVQKTILMAQNKRTSMPEIILD